MPVAAAPALVLGQRPACERVSAPADSVAAACCRGASTGAPGVVEAGASAAGAIVAPLNATISERGTLVRWPSRSSSTTSCACASTRRPETFTPSLFSTVTSLPLGICSPSGCFEQAAASATIITPTLTPKLFIFYYLRHRRALQCLCPAGPSTRLTATLSFVEESLCISYVRLVHSTNSDMEETISSDTPGERVLIVEDDHSTRTGLAELVQNWGFQTDEAPDGEEALHKVTSFRPAIIVSDLVMPRMGGHDLLRALKDQLSDITFILLTAQGTIESAVDAIKDGAYDYLSKPVDPQRLKILLEKSVERQETLREVRLLRRQLREQGSFGRIVGNSPAIRSLYRVIEQAAPTAASVLIWGESGTGKELIAQTIHELSPRATFPFVAINCAAIPETLLESEIFGHEKGAFTGAHDRRTGVFELAHRGTLFLDEIAEMQPATQVKLLRVLQERTFRRLGGRQEQTVDVRVIAATNQDPTEAVRAGKLREDLYYRLNVFMVELPPLRHRREDIPLLVQAFLNEFNQRNSKSVRAVGQDAMYLLERYPWPGNIRELRNVIERATILADADFIEQRHLPPSVVTRSEESLPTVTLAPGTTVDEAERRLILLTLEHTRNNKTRAAEILGISLKTLHNKLNRMKQETGVRS